MEVKDISKGIAKVQGPEVVAILDLIQAGLIQETRGDTRRVAEEILKEIEEAEIQEAEARVIEGEESQAADQALAQEVLALLQEEHTEKADPEPTHQLGLGTVDHPQDQHQVQTEVADLLSDHQQQFTATKVGMQAQSQLVLSKIELKVMAIKLCIKIRQTTMERVAQE